MYEDTHSAGSPAERQSLDDARIDTTLEQLFDAAQAQLEPNAQLVQAVTTRAQRQRRQRGLVLIAASGCGLLCCLLFLLPAVAALAQVLEALPELGLAVLAQLPSERSYLLPLAVAAIVWLGVLSAEPG